VTRAFNRQGHLALMLRAVAGYAARHYLAPLRDVPAEPGGILVVDMLDLVHTERADSPSGSASSLTLQCDVPPIAEAIARGA
jgi:hypothetical protein